MVSERTCPCPFALRLLGSRDQAKPLHGIRGFREGLINSGHAGIQWSVASEDARRPHKNKHVAFSPFVLSASKHIS